MKPGWGCVGVAAKATRVGSASLGPRGGGPRGGGSGRDPPGQHDGRAVGEVAGPGPVATALQCEGKADEARADGEAELQQEAQQEVVLGLREAETRHSGAWFTGSSGSGQARGG